MKDVLAVCAAMLLFFSSAVWLGRAEGAGYGFTDHGVAVPLSDSRGIVATVDGQGRDICLVWLSDHGGGYALLLIDAATGKTEQFPVPFPPGEDAPFASLLSSRNKYYTHFNNHFIEFDVTRRAFTFCRETAPKTAMSMTEDDKGVIWSATYPQCGIVSYAPATGEFRDYGSVYKQNWAEYPRSIAADDKGWIYVALGFTASQIIIFDPSTAAAWPVLPEWERKSGMAYLYRDADGRVYGKALQGAAAGWYEFHQGRVIKVGEHGQIKRKPIIAGEQSLLHNSFPDGKRIVQVDLAERRLVVEDPRGNGAKQELQFDYSTNGAVIMSLSATPDGAVYGGATLPTRFFSYDPRTNQWANRECYNQWNTVASQGERVFIGGYPGGFLLEWDPSRPWQKTKKKEAESNPLFLGEGTPAVNRPSKILACPDGKTIVLAGTPEYGFTGGGLLFWDRELRKTQVFADADIIPGQSTVSLTPLQGDRLLGGTTTAPGTGGEKKAREAELYVMDLATKKLLWHQAVLPGAQEYTDLCLGPYGLVYGIADRKIFFVFDPVELRLIRKKNISPRFGPTTWQQGLRSSLPGRAERCTCFLRRA